MKTLLQSTLVEQMFVRFGPMVSGQDLYQALGFKTYAAFHRSKKRNEIEVNVFTLPGRRGWFALTADVAVWLNHQSKSSSQDK